MVFNILPPVTFVMLAALVLIFTGCFRNIGEAYKTIKWESVVLVGAMLPMFVAMQKTDAATAAATELTGAVGSLGPYALLAAIYAAASVITLFLSNTATAALCAPIVMQAAEHMHLSLYPFLMAMAAGASICLASPLFHAGQRARHVAGTVCVHELCQAARAAADPSRRDPGIGAADFLPLLSLTGSWARRVSGTKAG